MSHLLPLRVLIVGVVGDASTSTSLFKFEFYVDVVFLG